MLPETGAAAHSHLQAWEMLFVAACSCAAAAARSSVSALLAITAMYGRPVLWNICCSTSCH
jgi:hypothetical protein